MAGKKQRHPLYVLFLLLMLLSSTGKVPPQVVGAASGISRICLVLAIAAVGVKTSLEELLHLGWRPMLLFVGETLFIAALVLVAVWMHYAV